MKTVHSVGEFGLIQRIARRAFQNSTVITGIGDDAAVLRSVVRPILLATDMLVEGVDFSFRKMSAAAVGRKALAVNLSDVAAMGGVPRAALVALAIPRNAPLRQVEDFFSGLNTLAKRYRTPLAGGDLSRGSKWTIAVSILGSVTGKHAALRRGARANEWIAVTGSFGGSIRRKHWSFTPRIPEGQFLARAGVSAMIDVSDGLMQDLEHLLRASGVSAEIDLNHVPVSPDAHRLATGDKRRSLRRALSDGEDFELLFTISKSKWAGLERAWRRKFRTPLTVIGKTRKGKADIKFTQNGKRADFSVRTGGFRHF